MPRSDWPRSSAAWGSSLRLACICAGALAFGALASAAGAQEPEDTPACDGLIVREIVITPLSPFMGGMMERWQFVGRFLSDMHVTSRPEALRSFLALEVGQPCTEFRRAESERILRAQPFIADAVVDAQPDGQGGVRILVSTVDELTVIFSGRASLNSPMVRGLRVGEGNLLGRAFHAEGEWRAGSFGRDGYGMRLTSYQLFGRPYQLALDVQRFQLGSRWETSIGHPFYTDLQRVAWAAEGGEREDWVPFSRDSGDAVALVAERTFGQLGGVLRVGPPGRLSLFGASLSLERTRVRDTPWLITPDGPVEFPVTLAAAPRFGELNAARVNALWGVRAVSYMRAVAFDALTAVQDVRVGFQGGATVGRSLGSLGSDADDLFISGSIYAGFGTPRSFVQIEAMGEGRQDFDGDHWDGVLTSGRAAWYGHLVPRHTWVASGEWSAGWNTLVPLSLALGATDGGVRGYRASRAVGEGRAVMRLENRVYLGQYGSTAQYGVAVFADAGKTWAGDAFFGQTTPVRTGIGASLLLAVPPRSQRMWRIDLAYPLSDDPRAGLELRFSSSNANGREWQPPGDLQRSRSFGVPGSIFRWP